MGLLPKEVMDYLSRASWRTRTASAPFQCQAFGNEWDRFVESWGSRVYDLVGQCLGPFGEEPQRVILPLRAGDYLSGANASYMPGSGQVRLSPQLSGKPGVILEKLCHELTHASLARFPEGDPFYEEGFVDYSVWVMSHAPTWGKLQPEVQASAMSNLLTRRERAKLDQSDWDRKRWAGGVFAASVRGPWILAALRMKKMEGNYTW